MEGWIVHTHTHTDITCIILFIDSANAVNYNWYPVGTIVIVPFRK